MPDFAVYNPLVDMEWDAEVLDTQTGKTATVASLVMKGESRIGWHAYTPRRQRLFIPIDQVGDGKRYEVTKGGTPPMDASDSGCLRIELAERWSAPRK